MTRKSALAIAIIAGTIFTTNIMNSTEAHAGRKLCDFAAFNGSTYQTSSWRIFERGTHRKKTSTACKRAKRKCERKLKRAKRRNEIPRGVRTPECLRH